MAITEEQKRAEWDLKESIREKVVAEEVALARKKTQEYRNVVRAEREQERIEDTKDTDGKLYWDKVKEDAHRMVNDGVAGYNSWDTGMSNLVSRCLTLANASWYDPIFPFRDQIVGAKNVVIDMVWDNTGGRISDAIDRARFKNEDLPKCELELCFDADGEFKSGLTIDKKVSNEPVFQELKQLADTGVVAWAMTQGYEHKKDPVTGKYGYYHETDNSKLTPEVIERIGKDNPEQSIQAFFNRRYQMPLSVGCAPAV